MPKQTTDQRLVALEAQAAATPIIVIVDDPDPQRRAQVVAAALAVLARPTW